MSEIIDWGSPETIDSIARGVIRAKRDGDQALVMGGIILPGVLDRIMEIEKEERETTKREDDMSEFIERSVSRWGRHDSGVEFRYESADPMSGIMFGGWMVDAWLRFNGMLINFQIRPDDRKNALDWKVDDSTMTFDRGDANAAYMNVDPPSVYASRQPLVRDLPMPIRGLIVDVHQEIQDAEQAAAEAEAEQLSWEYP